MTNKEILVLLDELFGGRRDTYARGRPRENNPNKYEWPRVKEPLTADVLVKHLKGEHIIGIWPIVDGQVKWSAVDFDCPKSSYDEHGVPDPEAVAIALRSAVEQKRVFEAQGLFTYLERSRSGNGLHLWIFFDEWQPAADIRRVVKSLLLFDPQEDGYDRLYPVQESVDGLGKKLGNLLALPYAGEAVAKGNSMFLDDNMMPIPLREFLPTVRMNATAVVRHLIESTPPEKPRRNLPVVGAIGAVDRPEELVTGALKMISPYGCKFMRNAWVNRRDLPEPMWDVAISQCTYFENGRELAHALSRDYKGYSPAETDARFDRKMQHPGHGCNYIREHFPQLACAGCSMKAPYHEAKKSIIELASEAHGEMEVIGSFQDDLKLIRDLNSGKAQSGLSWGLPGMDAITRLRPSELTIVGGLPSIGKTHLLTDTTYSMAKLGSIPLVFSAETARVPLRQRLLARSARVELTKLRGEHAAGLSKQEWAALDAAAAELETLQIIHDFSTMSPEAILVQIERTLLRRRIPLDATYAIFFDYLQFGLRKPGEDTDREHIKRSVGEFKFICKILEHPSAVFSQLKRELEGARPGMNAFADSSDIERNMDVGIVIGGDRTAGPIAAREAIFVKQREGRANESVHFVLKQGWGEWCSPDYRSAEVLEDLSGDFNVGN